MTVTLATKAAEGGGVFTCERSLVVFRPSHVTEVPLQVKEEKRGNPLLYSGHMMLVCNKKVSRQFTGFQ